MADSLKVLSILQPWAWLIANGYKDIENRSWSTRFRGEFIIHAGKKWGREQRDDLWFVRENFPAIEIPGEYIFRLGGIVGAATMTDCVAQSDSPWFVGHYGFVLEQQRSLPFIPWRGQLGWFDIPRIAAYPEVQSRAAT